MFDILDLKFLGTPETIASFLLKTEDGIALFECGPHSVFNQLEMELERHKIRIQDITHLFLTHIHFDHAGAAWALAKNGTQVFVHPNGYRHLINPERLYNSAKRIYEDKMEYLWGKMEPISEHNLNEVGHGETYHLGKYMIKAHHTPGHASHHIAWQINENIITGDIAGCKIDGGPVVPPCPPPDINIEQWVESINLGLVNEIEKHLDQLEIILWDWANFIKPYFENQTPIAEIIPHFQKYTAMQLREEGINDELLVLKYENANPAWMSVAGLMRYWKKKEEGNLE